MKYPFELSEDRLSLLTEEERRIYNYEHSDYYSASDKQDGFVQYQQMLTEKRMVYYDMIQDDEEYDEMSDTEKMDMAEGIAKYEARVIMDDVMDVLQEAFKDDTFGLVIVRDMMFNALNEHKVGVLNEADSLYAGADMTGWMKDMGWIGKLAGVALTGLLGAMIALIMAGKDAAAMDSLEKYMNKLVERVDDGIHKKRTLWGKLMGKLGFNNEHDGDQSNSCMRQIQENFSKGVACQGMVYLKQLGMLPDKTQQALTDIEMNKYSDGGFQYFLDKISYPVAKLANKN